MSERTVNGPVREIGHTPRDLKTRFHRMMKDGASWELLVLCVPCLFFMLMFHYIPWVSGLALPFKNYRPVDGIWGSAWCGLDNFRWMSSSSRLLRALRNSVLYGFWWQIICPVTNVGIALLLFDVSSRKAVKVYQTAICFPMFISMVIVGFISYAVLSPRYGLLNQTLSALGLKTVDVYMNAAYWPAILTIVSRWGGIGGGSMLYYASLTNIDPNLYEAACIDGASHWQRTRYISIPHLMPIVSLGLIMGIGGILGGSFDLHYLIPMNSSLLYSTTDILPTFVMRALMGGELTQSASSSFLTSIAGSILVIGTNAIVRKISPENSML